MCRVTTLNGNRRDPASVRARSRDRACLRETTSRRSEVVGEEAPASVMADFLLARSCHLARRPLLLKRSLTNRSAAAN